MWYFNTVIIILFTFTNDIASEDLNKIIIPNTERKNKIDKGSECIAQIVEDHISCKSVLFILSSSGHEDFLFRSIYKYYCFSVVTRSFSKERLLKHPDAYLITVKNATDFLRGIHKTSEDLSWNPKASFVILFKKRFNEFTEIFQELINLMILKVVLLTNSRNDEWEAFTYYLHNGKYCSRNASTIRSLGYCPKFTEPLFPDVLQNDFNNCTFMVAAREELPFVVVNNTEYDKYLESGVEQFVLETIAKQVGINIQYKYVSLDEDFGFILPNRTATGLLSYLQRYEVNMVIGGLFLSGTRLEVFDYIYGYSYAMFSVYTPFLLEERWSRVYKQFSGVTWLLIVVCFFLTVLVILITKTLSTGKSKDALLIILKLWRYFYGHADVQLFKDKYVKRFLIVWIIFTSYIYAFYNTASYSLITGHVQDKIIINHSDLTALPFKPCINDFTRDYFSAAYNESFPKNQIKDAPSCQSSEMVLNSVAMRSDLYTVDTDFAYYLRAINYIDADGQPTLTKWDYPRTDMLSIYLSKGFPLREIFQKYAQKIHESGLIQRHLSNIYSRKPKRLPTLQRRYNAIRLEDFRIHYCVLLIGSLISFISFIIEYKMGN